MKTLLLQRICSSFASGHATAARLLRGEGIDDEDQNPALPEILASTTALNLVSAGTQDLKIYSVLPRLARHLRQALRRFLLVILWKRIFLDFRPGCRVPAERWSHDCTKIDWQFTGKKARIKFDYKPSKRNRFT